MRFWNCNQISNTSRNRKKIIGKELISGVLDKITRGVLWFLSFSRFSVPMQDIEGYLYVQCDMSMSWKSKDNNKNNNRQNSKQECFCGLLTQKIKPSCAFLHTSISKSSDGFQLFFLSEALPFGLLFVWIYFFVGVQFDAGSCHVLPTEHF